MGETRYFVACDDGDDGSHSRSARLVTPERLARAVHELNARHPTWNIPANDSDVLAALAVLAGEGEA